MLWRSTDVAVSMVRWRVHKKWCMFRLAYAFDDAMVLSCIKSPLSLIKHRGGPAWCTVSLSARVRMPACCNASLHYRATAFLREAHAALAHPSVQSLIYDAVWKCTHQHLYVFLRACIVLERHSWCSYWSENMSDGETDCLGDCHVMRGNEVILNQ